MTALTGPVCRGMLLAALANGGFFVSLAAQGGQRPDSSLTGTWRIELERGPVSFHGERPRSVKAVGTLRFGFSDPEAESWDGGRYHFGRSEIDLRPLFGGPIVNDASATVFGPADSLFETEINGARRGPDSVWIDLIPRVSHGGLSLEGRASKNGSVVRGIWYQRAYCCGIQGRFTMRRVSRAAPEIAPRPEFRPAPPPDRTKMGRFRVRVWDTSARRWASTEYVIREPDGSMLSGNIHTADSLDGWGPDYWVLPGQWGIELERFRCGTEEWWFPDGVRRDTTVAVGDVIEFTVTLPMDSIGAKPSYMNPAGAVCPRDRRYPAR